MATLLCPNKTPEWKQFVKKVGSEEEAYRLWEATKYVKGEPGIPTNEELEAVGYEENYVPKAQMLISLLNQQLKDLYSKLGRAKTPEEKASIKIRIEDKKKEIEDLSELKDSKGVRKLVALEDVGKYAVEQLDYVENLLKNKDKLTFEDLQDIRRITAMWRKAGDFSGQDHLFFDEEELTLARKGLKNNEETVPYMTTIMQQFSSWKLRAEGLSKDFTDNAIALIEEVGRRESGDLDFKLETVLTDMGWTKAMFIGASESDNKLFELLHILTKKANHNAYTETLEIHKEIDELLARITKKHKLADVFDLFKQTQSNTDNRETGDVTFRYSQSYFKFIDDLKETRRLKLLNAGRETDENKRNSKINKINKEYFSRLRENSISFDARMILPDSELYDKTYSAEEVAAHKAEMIATLGQKGYDLYLQRAIDKIERYKEDRMAYLEAFNDKYGEGTREAELEFMLWDEAHNPYKVAEHNIEGTINKIGNQYVAYSSEYIETVPRRTMNNKDTGYYDKKFEQIEADDDILAFYEYFLQTMKTLNEYLPKDKTKFMHINTLVNVKKGFFESAIEGGITNFGSDFMDLLIRSTRTEDLATQVSPESRDVTGISEKELQVQFLRDNQARVAEHIKLESIIYKQENGVEPSRSLIEEWKKDFLHKLAQEKSFDIGKVLKAYSAMVMGYKNKSMVEDMFRISEQIFQDSLEQQINNAGDPLTYRNTNNRPVTQKGLARSKIVLDDMMNYFWGYATNKVEGQTKKKQYTKLERQEKRKIEGAIKQAKEDLDAGKISNIDYLNLRRNLDDRLRNLGGKFTTSKFLDMIMQWIQLKGMGWNFLAAGANMGFGTIANITEASANERFTSAQLRKAYGLTLHSMSKFWSGGAVNTEVAQKIYNLSEKFDMLKASRYELVRKSEGLETFGKFTKGFKYVMPFTAQSSSEYVNQAPVMIAVLMNKKVTLEDGTEISMWDAYDKDGNLKEGVKLDDNKEFTTKVSIDEAIRYLHGNYDPDARIAAKQFVMGRMALQFKTWALMGFYSRFGAETPNMYGEVKKGRYRSYGTLYKELGAIQATFEITKQLLRKLAFQSTNFSKLVNEEGYFTEVDAANLRRNLTEIVIFMGLQAMGLALKAGLDDEEDKTSNRAAVLFSLINQMNRVETDLLFYSNPKEFERLQKNVLPIFSIVSDSYDLIDKSINLMTGGEDIYQSGPHKGESKAKVAFMKQVPLTTQIARMGSYTSRVFKTD